MKEGSQSTETMRILASVTKAATELAAHLVLVAEKGGLAKQLQEALRQEKGWLSRVD